MTARRLVVIIGAARSGTKLVRDCLAGQSGVAAIPYDINFIWRLGNEQVPHDELQAELLTDRVRTRIGRVIERWWSEDVLVEKSVSNTLRVPFVQAVYPDATFVNLVRDGYDVVESSYRQWLARPDWRYLLSKLRAFPPTQAPGYVARRAAEMAMRQVRRGERPGKVPLWGPVYDGLAEDVQRHGVLHGCAMQWRRCVEAASASLADLPPEKVIEIRYEDFVLDPRHNLQLLAKFVGLDASTVRSLALDVRTEAIGKGRRSLSKEQLAKVERIIEPTRSMLGYR